MHQPDPEDGGVIVDYFEQATIMFVNICNFQEITKNLYPLQLLFVAYSFVHSFIYFYKLRDPGNTFQVYNDLFTLFDEATRAYGLEKIKTVSIDIIK